MLYDSYELKIQNIAKIKNNIIKYKLLIISVLSIFFTGIIALISVNGMIVDDITFAPNIEYGESLSFEANVLFGSAKFEFKSLDSSNWTSDSPILPGEYEVRVVSSRSFGFKSYGDSFAFTISPKSIEVSVLEDKIIYGEKFDFYSELENDDYFYYGEVEYDNFYSLETCVTPILDSLVIYNSENSDVTSAYSISVISKDINFIPRTVVIEVESDSKEYDGTELSNNSYTISNLLDGHVEFVEINSSIINFGETYNLVDNAIIKYEGIDISHMYNIESKIGSLSITKKDIYITTSNSSKEYDSTYLFNDDYTYEGLLEKDSIEVISNTKVTHYGIYNNVLDFMITDNIDITSNYNFIFNYGKLEITKADLYVVTSSDEKEYDGAALFNEDMTFDGLFESDSIRVVNNSKIIYYGIIDNELEVAIYFNEINISSSYNIIYECGVLEITKKLILVSSTEDSKVYDGSILQNIEFTSSNNILTDEIVVVDNATIVDVGVIDNEIAVKVYCNDVDISSSYNIIYSYAKLEIFHREVNVVTSSDSKVYDATSLSKDGWIYNNSSFDLVEGHSLEIVTIGSSLNVWDDFNNYYESYTLLYLGEDVSFNYNLTIGYGELEIIQRDISLKTGSLSKEYDDTELTYDYYEFINNTLLENHIFSIDIIGSRIDAGKSYNLYENVCVMYNEDDVTKNYNFDIEIGILTVDARIVGIKANNATKVYDDSILKCEEWSYVSNVFVDGHELYVEFIGSIVNVGVEVNSINASTIRVYRDSVDVTDNYIIVLSSGELEITHREVSINAVDDSKVYDDIALENNDWEYYDTLYEFVFFHKIVIENYSSITNIGSIDNVISNVLIYSNNIDVTSNYIISTNNGTLSVSKRNVIVSTNSNSYIYDGTYQYDSNYNIDNLVSGHSSFIIAFTGEKDVIENGSNKYYISISNGDDVTGNYNVEYDYGKLVITPREVYIKASVVSKVYDNILLKDSSYTYVLDSLEFVNFHNVVVTNECSIINVGDVDNIISDIVIYDGEENVSKNYNISIEKGTLEITQRSVLITSKYLEETYDGNEHYNIDVDVEVVDGDRGLIFGSIKIESYATIVNVGDKENKVVVSVYNGEDDISYNYNIQYDYDILLITQRTVSIVASSSSKVYDNKVLSDDNWEYEDNSLEFVKTHTIEFSNNSSIINVGSVDNVISDFNVYDNEENVSGNYNISIKEGTLEITQRSVLITTNSLEKVYDGNEYFNKDIDVETVNGDRGLIFGKVEIISYSTVKYVDSIDNEIKVKIYNNDVDITYNYNIECKTGSLTITKKDLLITTYSLKDKYNGSYLEQKGYSTYGLIDEINIIGTTKVYFVSDGSVENVLKFEIYNSEKNDLSYCYNIFYQNGYIEMIATDINITTGDDEKEYDGLSFDNKDISGSLLGDDKFNIINVVDDKFVGAYSNEIKYYISNGSDDVTGNYNVTPSYGTLIITARIIKITVGSDELIFNDEFQWCKSITPSKDFVDTFTVEYLSSIKYVGKIDNLISYTLDNENNYKIEVIAGTIEITPKEIVITTASDEAFYSGDSLTNYDYSTIGLLNSHELFVDVIGSITDVGVVKNTLDVNTILILDGDLDVTENYTWTIIEGELEIISSKLTLISSSSTKEYDGNMISIFEFELINSLGEVILSSESTYKDGYYEFDNKDRLYIEFNEYGPSIGTYINEFSFVIKNSFNEESDNYEIERSYGELIINKIKISFESEEMKFEFDQNEHVHEVACEKIDISSKLLDGHKVEYNFSAYIINPGDVENTFDVKIFDGEKDVTDLYEIDYIFNFLYVIPSKLLVVTNTVKYEYNGDYQFDEGYEVYWINDDNEKVLIDVTFIVSSNTKIKNVGDTSNDLVLGIEDGDIKEFYDIEYEYGKLSITKKSITVYANDVSYEYNGYYQEVKSSDVIIRYDDNEVKGGIDGNIINVTSSVGSTAPCETKYNDIKIDLLDTNNDSVLNNYSIIYEQGSFEITKRKVEIKIRTVNLEYNSEDQYSQLYDFVIGSFAEVDTFVVESSTTKNEIGTYENIFESYHLEGKELSDYYDLTILTGELIITKIKITITTQTAQKEYDGESLIGDILKIEGNVLNSDELFFTTTGSITNVLYDEFNNIIGVKNTHDDEYYFYNKDNSTLSDYYEITVELGELIIYPKDINIVLFNVTKEYQEVLVYEVVVSNYEVYYTLDNLYLDHVLNLSIVEESFYEEDVLLGKICYDSFVVIDGDLNDYSGNYNIIVKNDATVTFIQRVLKITAESISKQHDGETLYSSECEVLGLIEGHTVSVVTSGHITSVGSVKNTIVSYEIRDLEGNDVSWYYSIYTIDGTLTIT